MGNRIADDDSVCPGHCLPIVLAGSSTALVRKLTENHLWQGAGNWFRKAAGVVVGCNGVVFHGSSIH
jgi:cytochrome c-type biogenesis protein